MSSTAYPDLVDPQEETSLQSGQRVFGRYLLDRVVGRGGIGIVWKAHDETLDRPVALKFLPDSLFRDTAARDEMKRETRHCLDLTHPYIVRIHDFVEDGEMAAIAMEYVDGSNLSELRMERPSRCFKPEELAPWVNSLCAALDYAHNAAHCVHRDLKPGNLMVNSRGALKVTDFGIASSTHHTATGVGPRPSSRGAVGYMSPQQLRGDLPSPSDDIYSVGATLYELLTGKPPFYRGDLSMQVREEIPESVMARRRRFGLPEFAIPAGWEETIAACLAKDPHQRPASSNEIARRLGLAGTDAPSNETAAPFYRRLIQLNLRAMTSRTLQQIATGIALLKQLPTRMAPLKRLASRMPSLKQLATQATPPQHLGTWMAPLKRHRWPIIIGAASLCAVLLWLMRSQPLPAPSAAPAVAYVHAREQPAAPAPIAPAPSVAPVAPIASAPPVIPAAPVASTAPVTPPAPVVPFAPITLPAPVAPVASTAPPPLPASTPASPAIPGVPQPQPQATPDQRALTEPIPAPQSAPQIASQSVSPQPSAVPAVPAEGAEVRTQVRIETIPAGIPFQILAGTDEAPTTQVRGFGVSPATLDLSKGGHRIVFSPTGEASRTISVQVPATGTALFQQEFPHGIVKVHSQPDLAEVICDGHLVGNAPLDLPLLPGRHVIAARWNGHEADARTVQLADADEQSLAFTFRAGTSKSSATRSHHTRKKEDTSVFTKIGRTFKNLFGGN